MTVMTENLFCSQGLIEDAMKEFMDKSCVKFHEKGDDDDYFLRFTYGDSCSSSIGKSGSALL
jgi:hypothetical protein